MRGGLSDGHAPIHPLDLQDIKELEVRARTAVDVDVVWMLFAECRRFSSAVY